MKEKVEAVIERIRPALQADGGDVELVGIEDGVVKVKLTGACGSCPMSTLTLKMGIERVIREELGIIDDQNEEFDELRQSVRNLKIPHVDSATDQYLTVSIGVGLIMPGSLGDSHKVMIQSKGVEGVKLRGFELKNQLKNLEA